MYVRQRGERDGKPVWSLRWEIRDPATGHRRYVYETFKGAERAAKRQWVKREAEIRAAGPGYVKPSRTELAEYLTDWLRRETDLRPTARDNYDNLCRLYIKPYLGAVPLADLTPAMLQDWLAELRGKVGPRTVALARTVLSHALKDAVRLGQLRDNPVDRTEGPRQDPKRRGAFTVGQAERLLAEAYRTTRLGPLLEFLWLTGLRPGEALGLLWNDVDLVAGTIHVHRSRVRVGGQMIEQNATKTEAGLRDLALPARAVEALRRQQLLQGQERLTVTRWTDTGLVFTTGKGTGLLESNVGRAERKLRRRLDLPDYPLYALRHTAASMQIAAGVPIEVLAKRLGHRHISMTVDVYGHLLPQANRQAAQALDDFLDREHE